MHKRCKAGVLGGAGLRPHKPVALDICGVVNIVTVREVRAPKAFPVQRPVGPAPPPPFAGASRVGGARSRAWRAGVVCS